MERYCLQLPVLLTAAHRVILTVIILNNKKLCNWNTLSQNFIEMSFEKLYQDRDRWLDDIAQKGLKAERNTP